jgi:ADP-ribose pyrophosphatase YjhB (NUDIX family)
VCLLHSFIYCPLCSEILQEDIIENRQRQFCTQCHYIHYINPIPAIISIGERDGKILLIKRGMEPMKGLWTLPGGFMEAAETPEAGCLRELFEETGMRGTIKNLIGVFHEFSQMYGDVLCIFYHVKLDDGTPAAGDDADNADLVPVDDVGDLGFICFNQAFGHYKARTISK